MKAGLERTVFVVLLGISGVCTHELRGGTVPIPNLGEESHDAIAADHGLLSMSTAESPCEGSDSCDHQPALLDPSPNTTFDNDLANQIICGYQGWFGYPGDGAAVDRWDHWFKSSADANGVQMKDLTVDLYPTVDEYEDEDLIETGIPMKDGTTHAKFYSAVKPNVVLKHFQWMATYGITGVFHMRFMNGLQDENNREWKTTVLRNVRSAAEATGRSFAVSYNVAGVASDDVLDEMKIDWMRLVDEEGIAQSEQYIRQDGLPVLRIYGIGFKDVRVSDTDRLAALIDWFQKGAEPRYRVFLVGGVPSRWREQTHDSREEAAWADVYDSLDGIQPWHVGRWSTIDNFEKYYSSTISADAEYCRDKGILYMPTMWPGFSWHNLQETRKPKMAKAADFIVRLGGFVWRQAIQRVTTPDIGTSRKSLFDETANNPINKIPRLGGTFMWRQAYRYIADSNIGTIWMAQFDEVDEGTAIFKVAATSSDLPAEGDWLALDGDGRSLPSDWYLRLCGEAQKMLEGKIGLTPEIPIAPFSIVEDVPQTERRFE